ncbi:MAG: cytochrome c oxidase subunit II [Almyronema sp.]
MKQIPASLLTLVAGVLITLVSLWVGQHHGLLPEQASEQAPLVDQLFSLMVTIATALFIVVEGAIVWFLIRYRQRPGDETDGIPIEGNLPLEAFWTAIPAIIIIGLSVYSVDVFQQMGGAMPGHPPMPAAKAIADSTPAAVTPALSTSAVPRFGYGATPTQLGQDPDLVVNVTGMQYAWIFNYPDTGVVTGELHIPVGKSVQLNISGQDVIHSFWVPQFRLKQDAIPGQQTGLRFAATQTGIYPIVCTELCGSYHGAMRSQVVVQSAAEFDQWLAQSRLAQSPAPHQVVAANVADLSVDQFLSPYAAAMGMTTERLPSLLPTRP